MRDWQVKFSESAVWSPQVALKHRFADIFIYQEHSIVVELLTYFLEAVS